MINNKMENKKTNKQESKKKPIKIHHDFLYDSWILCLKEIMVKSVIYLLFCYQTVYNVTLHTLSDT